MKHQLFEKIEKFKTWSGHLDETPEEQRTGSWEDAYAQWNEVDAAFIDFINKSSPADWTAEAVGALLYLIARDHASEIFADLVAAHPDKLAYLARRADAGSPGSRWQLAVRLPELGDRALAESLLLRFIDDPDEYVRRRTLHTLAEIGSVHTEPCCLAAWQQGSHQPAGRVAVLEALFKMGSPKLYHYLQEAQQDGNPHLLQSAAAIERQLSAGNH